MCRVFSCSLLLFFFFLLYCQSNARAEGILNDETQREPDCGISTKDILFRRRRGGLSRHKRIIGGEPAVEGDWPWIAALINRQTGDFICGGTLVNTQHVVTAQHCLEKLKATDLTVRLGALDLTSPGDESIDLAVSEIISHSGYDQKNKVNDIALLKLTARVNTTDSIRPICIATTRLSPGQMTFIAGWGSTTNLGSPSQVLIETHVPIWRNELCNEVHRRTIGPNQVCAGWKVGGRDSCGKDGGSPMMIQNESGRWELVGLISLNRACARPNTPAIYTRISAHAEWIKTRSKPQINPVTIKLNHGCGNSLSHRIVGGQRTEPGQWPWMASLLLNQDSHFCGGVLITNQHILTATHCVRDLKADQITVRLGEYDLQSESEFERNYGVETIWLHPNYTHRYLRNDIALLKLNKKVEFTEEIQTVCLPPNRIDLKENVYVIGWGQTSFFGSSSPVLLQVQLSVWNSKDCQSAYPRLSISDSQICAGHKSGGKDSCQGDSGGPLLYKLENGRWAVVGIVSGGQGCGDANKPGIYTRVSSFENWIKSSVLNNNTISLEIQN